MEKIVEDLRLLYEIDKFPVGDSQGLIDKLRTKEAQIYIHSLAIGGKPETAMSDYLFRPLMENSDNLGLHISPQIKAGEGWVDYLIRSDYRNPVAIELKPLLTVKNGKICANSVETEYQHLKNRPPSHNQIIQYLRDYDSVVLTDMKDIYYFNREAIVDFKPFLKEDFLSFAEDLKMNPDVWDVIRRKEDTTVRHDLDKSFFIDLRKWFHEYEGLTFNPSVDNKEEIVRLLNKFIFLKTLEDHALIPFNYIRDTYEEKRKKWGSKGKRKVFYEFFKELTHWSYEFYDTELFRENTFDLLAQDSENIKILESATEKVLGLSLWDKTFGLGLIHYNYRSINEDIFGKAYEAFLAEERKERGIFYTPNDITEYMSRKIVNELFLKPKKDLFSLLENGDYDGATRIADYMSGIKIVDLSCGSGSFLVKVFHHIWKIYCEINDKTIWATTFENGMFEPEPIVTLKKSVRKVRERMGIGGNHFDERRAVACVVLRHIFGADVDEKAIDVAKVNIWKEAIKLAASNFRYSSLPESMNHVLPDLELNFVILNTIVDIPIDDSTELMTNHHKTELAKLVKIREGYLEDPYNPEVLEEAGDIKQQIRHKLTGHFLENYEIAPPGSFFPLEFFFCYFDGDGELLSETKRGFNGVIGNPPWENIKPIKKEFAAKHYDVFGKLSKFSIEGKEFEKKFEEALEQDSELNEMWHDYCRNIQLLSRFLRHNYKFYGTSGDLSYQKIFLERAADVMQQDGFTALLVPSGFHTDEGQKQLRQHIIGENTLLSLMSFENLNQRWFPDIHPSFKFDAVIFKKAPNDSNIPFNARFYIHQIEEVDNPVRIDPDIIKKFSPSTMGIVELQSEKDAEIVTKIRGDHSLLGSSSFRLSSEFHMTNDNNLFHKEVRNTGNGRILYEGKMLHQYEDSFDEPRYWIEDSDGRKTLLLRECLRIRKFAKDNEAENDYEFNEQDFNERQFKLDYEDFRLAYRAIARSTDNRTLIATILPPNVFLGHSINFFRNISYDSKDNTILQNYMDHRKMLYLQALLNSLTIDYYIRLRVSANITMFFIYELPIPVPSPLICDNIVQYSLDLMPDDDIYDNLAMKAGLTKQKLSDNEKKVLRSILEASIAKDIYGLSKDDLAHILSTFAQTDKEFMEMVITS